MYTSFFDMANGVAATHPILLVARPRCSSLEWRRSTIRSACFRPRVCQTAPRGDRRNSGRRDGTGTLSRDRSSAAVVCVVFVRRRSPVRDRRSVPLPVPRDVAPPRRAARDVVHDRADDRLAAAHPVHVRPATVPAADALGGRGADDAAARALRLRSARRSARDGYVRSQAEPRSAAGVSRLPRR